MSKHELTRRDALAALATAGVAASSSALTWESLDETSRERTVQLTAHDRELLHAVATVVYPSEVTGIEGFVEAYVVGRATEDPDRLAGIVRGVRYVDTYAKEWYDTPYLELSTGRRETVLSAMGADVSDPDPDGSDVERLRFYVVNELLYALYTSPVGTTLLGLENPQGYPGGSESYQRGPPE